MMLITNVILFVCTVCSSFATLIDTSVAASIRLRRGVVYSNPEIRNNQSPTREAQTTPRVSSLQNINPRGISPHYRNLKASDAQKAPYASPNDFAGSSGSHAYGTVPPKRQLPFDSSSGQQTESHRKSPFVPYFDTSINPNVYGAAISAEKPLDASKLIVSPSLSKLQNAYSSVYNSFHQNKPIELGDFADFEYPSYAGISKLMSQDFQATKTPAVQVPVYKTSYPLTKVEDYAHTYMPGLASASLQSPSKTSTNKQKDEAIVDVNGRKISVPVIRIESNPDFGRVLPVFENQPFLMNYPAGTDLGGFGFGAVASKSNLTPQSEVASPFLSPLSSFQGQVVPIQTTGGSPQFPQYKGASVEVYPVPSNLPKAQGSYESLYSQPQLHFGGEDGSGPINLQQNTVQSSVSMGDILDDVEIVNKKNPEPHTPQPDDDEEEDERYKNPEEEHEHNSEDDSAEHQSGKYFKEPPTESNFKPSTSFPFKEYDEKFGKYKAQTDDEDSEEKPYSGYKNYSLNDDDKEDESSSEDHAEYVKSSKPSRDSDEEEDEDEEESHKHEKTNDNFYQREPKRSRYYGKDFEQEFEEAYRKELPKYKYVHTKEVPEIDSYGNPKAPRQQAKNGNRSSVNREQSEESRNPEYRIFHGNRKTPRTGYGDSAAYGTQMSANKAPRVIHEEFFGYRNPGGHSKQERIRIALEEHLAAKKFPKADGYLRAAKYYKFKSPKIGGRSGRLARRKDPHPHLAASWRTSEVLPDERPIAISNGVGKLSIAGDSVSFYGTNAVNGRARSLANAEILCDLTGI